MMYFIAIFSIGLIIGIALCLIIIKKSFISLLDDSIKEGNIKIKGVYYAITKMSKND